MSDYFEYDAQGSRFIESPCLSVESSMGQIALTWLNTKIRSFSLEPEYNHIEYEPEDGPLRAFTPSEQILSFLKEHHYQELIMPIADEATREWYIKLHSRLMAQEIDEFLAEPE